LIEFLGDSLPDGHYPFSAQVELNFRSTGPLPAGSASVSLPRSPLPASRTAGAVTYRAETNVESGATLRIRTTVVATLTHAGGSVLHYSRECPLVVYAYRDRARRDAAPRSGEPDWRSARSCGPELQELTLQQRDSRIFEVRATTREILGDRLPPGRYYFAAAVRAERRTVYLSAGEADLRR
jgi:hypothetical protein